MYGNPVSGLSPPADYGLGYVQYLDAGPALSIMEPVGTQPVSIPKNSTGYYNGLVGGATTANGGVVSSQGLAPFYYDSTANGDGTFNVTSIASGNYTVTGPGGAAVSAFTGTVDVSAAAAGFVWTNSSTFNDQTDTPVIPR